MKEQQSTIVRLCDVIAWGFLPVSFSCVFIVELFGQRTPISGDWFIVLALFACIASAVMHSKGKIGTAMLQFGALLLSNTVFLILFAVVSLIVLGLPPQN